MSAYWIKYRMNSWEKERGIMSPAHNKEEAYDRAVYELIPAKEKHHPYSAWVESVTYNNGRLKMFNTFEGKPY